ncbi:MAG: hypothetical protein ABL977_13875 [Candidatus Eisenbacteria bacterium]
MFDFDAGILIPLMTLSIPIVAIVGGIVAGIVRMMHRQRSVELIQRERIAAIERGLDPDKIASLQRPFMLDEHGQYTDHHIAFARLKQGLTIGGIITLFVGIALAVFLNGVTDGDDKNVWMVGLIPAAAGVAMLLSSVVIRPVTGGAPPHA